jgi:hypothetical protein
MLCALHPIFTAQKRQFEGENRINPKSVFPALPLQMPARNRWAYFAVE